MARLLTQFASSLGASQRAAISTLLSEGETGGEFENTNQMQDRLAALSQLITSSPALFQSYKVKFNELVDMGRQNTEYRLARLDLNTLYQELDAIDNTVENFIFSLRKRMGDIDASINTISNSINSLELERLSQDYNRISYNTFGSHSTAMLPFDSEFAALLYKDPRSGLGITTRCSQNTTMEALTLPTMNLVVIPITEIQLLEGAATTASDLDVNPVDNSLNNILIDGDGLAWFNGVLKIDTDFAANPITPPDYVQFTINISLGTNKAFNTLTISPVIDRGFELSSIQVLDPTGSYVELLDEAAAIDHRTQLVFNEVIGSELKLLFKQYSYTTISDFTSSDVDITTEYIKSVTSQTTLQNIVIGVAGSETTYNRGYLYCLALDFIEVGRQTYSSRGIFVSTPVDTDAPVTDILLASSEIIPISDANLIQGSIEYYAAKYDYVNGVLVRSNIVPIRHGSDEVENELLMLSSGKGDLRFFPDYNSIIVKRNGTTLILGTDYELSVDSGVTSYDNLVDLGTAIIASKRPTLTVVITDPLLTDIYTVDYTIELINPNFNTAIFLDTDEIFAVTSNGLAIIKKPWLPIDTCKLFLIVIMRSFSVSNNRDTPVLNDYTLSIRELNV